MLIKNIVREVNRMLADELLSFDQMRIHLDRAIDGINDKLSSAYPVFSELDVSATEYAYFPDSYIRQVVIPGAAYHFYLTDEEGAPAAQAYGQMYANGLYIMMRDYITQVPAAYEKRSDFGAVPFNLTGADDEGLVIGEMRP